MNMNQTTKTFTLNFRKKKGSEAPARAPIEISYAGYVGEATDNESVQIAAAVNATLEQYAKMLVSEKESAGNCEYVPERSEVTLEAWNRWNTAAVTRTRAVTAATLSAFADLYEILAVELLGKQSGAAKVGAQVIRNKLVPVIGNTAAMSAMESNLLAIVESEDSRLEDHSAVVDYLLKVIAESQSVVTADSL